LRGAGAPLADALPGSVEEGQGQCEILLTPPLTRGTIIPVRGELKRGKPLFHFFPLSLKGEGEQGGEVTGFPINLGMTLRQAQGKRLRLEMSLRQAQGKRLRLPRPDYIGAGNDREIYTLLKVMMVV